MAPLPAVPPPGSFYKACAPQNISPAHTTGSPAQHPGCSPLGLWGALSLPRWPQALSLHGALILGLRLHLPVCLWVSLVRTSTQAQQEGPALHH